MNCAAPHVLPIHRVALAALLVCAFAIGAASSACTPRDRDALAPAIVPGIKASCVLLRAFFKDGTLSDICVTADDLAPLVSEIIAEREARGAQDGLRMASMAPGDGPIVAFAIRESAAPKLVPKRRCAVWVSVDNASRGGDGGTQATTPRASDASVREGDSGGH